MLVPNADSLGSFDFGAQQKIQKVFREAPMHGIHFVCHWQNPVALSAQLGSSGLSSFDGVAVWLECRSEAVGWPAVPVERAREPGPLQGGFFGTSLNEAHALCRNAIMEEGRR